MIKKYIYKSSSTWDTVSKNSIVDLEGFFPQKLGIGTFFSVEGQTANNLGFSGHLSLAHTILFPFLFLLKIISYFCL